MSDQDLTREELVAELQRLRRFQEIVEATPDLVSFGDANTGRIQWMNAAGRGMCGIGPDEDVGGIEPSSFYPESFRRKLALEILPRALREGMWAGDSVVTGRDGHETHVSQVITIHRGPTGEIEGGSTIARDITESVAAAESLRRHRDELAAIAVQRDQSLERLQEQARLAEQQARVIVDLQRRALLELSTPVIQVWDEILVLPLIGIIDTARAQQIVESLLDAVVRARAAVVILDVTGVPVVDTQVADHLLKTVEATRLLGAEAILTGVSPSNAQALVGLGTDLGAVTTKRSLQEGLRLAFARTRRKVSEAHGGD